MKNKDLQKIKMILAQLEKQNKEIANYLVKLIQIFSNKEEEK